MDEETRQRINDLKGGSVWTTGQFTLAANPATSTSVERRSVSANSVVTLMPYGSNAAMSDIKNIVPTKGFFVVNHTASTTTREYRYTFVTGSIIP